MEPQLQRRVQRYGWDKAAEYYDDSWKAQLKPAQDKLMEMMSLQPGMKQHKAQISKSLKLENYYDVYKTPIP